MVEQVLQPYEPASAEADVGEALASACLVEEASLEVGGGPSDPEKEGRLLDRQEGREVLGKCRTWGTPVCLLTSLYGWTRIVAPSMLGCQLAL